MQTNFIWLLLSTGLAFSFFIYTKYFKSEDRTNFFSFFFIIQTVLLISLLSFGILFLINFIIYLNTYKNLNYLVLFNSRLVFKGLTLFEFSWGSFTLNLYGYIIILLALFVGFFALLVSDNKVKDDNTNIIFYFNYFILIVYLFVTINDIMLLFFCYELLLLPSFLFIYFISYTRKALQACLYFVIWTQFGSLLVLISIIYTVNLVGDSTFDAIRNFYFTRNETILIYTLLFFGFGFKLPIWPFHYWLTKTHVEASSGFSIYLSGFLVKSALYGFFTITNLLKMEFNTVVFSTIAFLGAVDASLKLWGQSDLKKLVAYCTIQEMNLILVTFLFGDTRLTLAGILFSAAHAFLSTLMFYLVDCIYRRFHSRSVYQVQGVMQQCPLLGALIFGMCILYAGLPGTIKFSCELLIFGALADSSFLTMFGLLVVVNIFGIIGFSKTWFNIIFGLPNSDAKKPILDLSKRELFISFYCFIFFILFNYLTLPLI